MFQAAMSNSTLSEEASLSNSFNPLLLQATSIITSQQHQQQQQTSAPKKLKKKRSLPGNPDPNAEVIALSPKTLLATNRFICEICNKGFQRDQNLQLHRRGHNLPWKLKQRNKLEVVRKKAYVCPEPSCVHHHPSRALGDLTGIKKHFCRKHGEKKYKCEKCSKIYAVHSDWKAHSKTCGTREYRCDCGTLFSRKDSFITHRAFCDALAEESARLSTNPFSNPLLPPPSQQQPRPPPALNFSTSQNHNSHLFPLPWDPPPHQNPSNLIQVKTENSDNPFSPPPQSFFLPPPLFTKPSDLLTSPYTSDTNTITAHFLSATALLQKATSLGTTNNTKTTLLHSPQTQQQQAQAMISAGFGIDELAPFHNNVGPTTTTATTTTTEMSSTPPPLQSSTAMTDQEYLATWRKSINEDITRDFLGLAAGDHHHHNHHHHQNYETMNGNNVGGKRSNQGNYHDGNDNEDGGVNVVGNMLKITGGGLQQYGLTAACYDRDNSSSSSSSSMFLKPHHQHHPLGLHHHQDVVDHQEGNFGNFVTTAAESRWG